MVLFALAMPASAAPIYTPSTETGRMILIGVGLILGASLTRLRRE
jgi:hypothetical protein